MRNHTKIVTLEDGYHVWTRSVGQGPIKILLLHGVRYDSQLFNAVHGIY